MRAESQKLGRALRLALTFIIAVCAISHLQNAGHVPVESLRSSLPTCEPMAAIGSTKTVMEARSPHCY